MRTIHRSLVLGGLWSLEWAWHIAETNLSCVRSSGICMPNLNDLACIVSEISAFIRPPIVSEISAFIRTDDGSEPLPFACYILFYGVGKASFCLIHTFSIYSIPFYFTSNGYN